ncbi:monooxygenase, putative [Talaromyces stipitatus ATCC 10500]|uniref:Monooxygenase, putative n=1 Tax=Talaromyces stipitatus (strain ATCC 10500 / CBS 375.48 / QM 6759 / NRRL 1006) TaxID=441959 RepID=B8MP14_TALSN|nr:monooxygenase, putative [Talaromyces stipitatus ATCC 10500]EED14253.1 monooxygenase, putative [Talaromyces stipitatus ATCC 10500]
MADEQQRFEGIRSIAVIGAGISGILATKYLLQAGLDVTVFERNEKPGGVWLYDEKKAPEPPYSVTEPLEASQALCPWYKEDNQQDGIISAEDALKHAPPGACYDGLTNNFSLATIELKDLPWLWEIPMTTPECPDHASEWTTHRNVLRYIQKAATQVGMQDRVYYRTLVERVKKGGDKWKVTTGTLIPIVSENTEEEKFQISHRKWEFDAVVVASGHYNTPRLPSIPGLVEWRETYPERVEHSKSYRHPQKYSGKNILLVGAGTSSTEIARELGPLVQKIHQSGRGSRFDLPLDFIPENCQRVAEIESFGTLQKVAESLTAKGHIPGKVTLKDRTVLNDIDIVIVCTGYHFAYPFMPDLHADNGFANVDVSKVLVKDGSCTLNLHKDMFYIPDPTLAFGGISQFISTFSFFEYQAMFIAEVFSGKASLPSQQEMRRIYEKRLAQKGDTRLMNGRHDEEVPYVDELIELINASNPARRVEGFSPKWHAARDAGKLQKIRARFAREKVERERKELAA